MHNKFSEIYDEFTNHVDYKEWYKFLKQYIRKDDKILDVGSGTGTLTKIFKDNGYNIIGLDISEDMINVAKKKDSSIEYILADITTDKLNINKKFKYVMSNFDTVNYFEDYDAFERFVINISKIQDNDSYLIFDLVLEEIFEEIFYDEDTFVDESDNYTAVWKYKKIDENRHKIDIDINMDDKLYKEEHVKYIYDIEKIVEILNKHDYYIYDMAKNPNYGESRIFVISRKEV